MSYSIDRDNYFSQKIPSRYEDIKNVVVVPFFTTFVFDTQQEVGSYGGPGVYSLGAGVVSEIEIEYKKDKTPVIDRAIDSWAAPVVTITYYDATETEFTPAVPATLTDSDFRPMGCTLEISTGLGGNYDLKVTVEGHQVILQESQSTAQDPASILSSGERTYRLKDNNLIQSPGLASTIAELLVQSYSDPRNELTLEWRGNPALELADEIDVPVYQRHGQSVLSGFRVSNQVLQYDGAFRATLNGNRYNKTFIQKTYDSGDTQIQKTYDTGDPQIQKVY